MNGGWGLGVLAWWLRGLGIVALGLLLLGLLQPAPAQAAHKLPNGPPPFAYPGLPPTMVLETQDDAPVAEQAAATPVPTPVAPPVPAPATGGLTLDRFAIGFLLIVVGTLGAGLAVLGLRRARRLRDAALPPRDSSSRRS